MLGLACSGARSWCDKRRQKALSFGPDAVPVGVIVLVA
jgi:hypothetical protein